MAPPVVAWTWYRLGEPIAWIVGIAATALVVRQFLAERNRDFYPKGLIITGVLFAAVSIPYFSWRGWAGFQHSQRVAKISRFERAGGRCGWDPTRIQFEGDSITNENLASISALTDTEFLELFQTRIDDAGLVAIDDWERLKHLSISYCPIGDDGLAHLASLNQISRLSILSNGVTDAGLEHLSNLRQLQRLTIQSNSVTAAAVKKLQQELRNCQITLHPMPSDAPNADWPQQ